MNIAHTTVAMMTITGAKALDPIRVIAEDIEPNKGRITINCYGKSWTAYWGGMGERTVAQFFAACDEHYLAKNLSDIHENLTNADAIQEAAIRELRKSRRNKELDQDDARELYEDIHDANFGDDGWGDSDLMQRIFGDEWWYSLPTKPNPDYAYLCRIIEAVQSAIRSEAGTTTPLEKA